ncbi:hypothetical protein EJ05DRAFT_330267 [Pseudovirgaria hyperparasitica]|uniref:DUF8035 domain-containing protein n=1 Tax=Pseudovirgaria hyperparasitica TaxID=470096 RepID=A0A6A6W863_9PEZI|nr:uncharacterized protein EJ05DRAFT_330267 [Pseudovirgaria hyperparasitica]KAF2759042.1 hypothetical protein EJ05DRAFT_330267 [Pseudovirgaria hyperparasitica]
MSFSACSCPSNMIDMGSAFLESRAPPPHSAPTTLSVPRQSHRHSVSTPRLTITTTLTPPSSSSTMADRYYTRPASPGGRRIAHSGRASATQLGGYDHYYGGPRASREYVDPRASGERIVPHASQYFTHAPSSSSTTGGSSLSRSSAGYDAYSGRPRRSTLEGNAGRPPSLNLSTRHRPVAVIHTQNDRPSSPLTRHYDDRGRDHDYSASISAPKREHKKVYSVDDGQSRLIEEKDIKPRRERRPSVERTGNRHSAQIGGSRQQYYPIAPIVAPRDTEDYYSYTDPAKMYSETEPSWRPRRNSVERSSRPSSMIIETAGPAMKPAREYGPPVSTRGFDKINGSSALGRSGSLRHTDRDIHHRTSSRERAPERPRDVEHTSVYRDNLPEPYILPQDVPPRSNSALPAPGPRAHQVRDDRERYRDTVYDEPASGRHHRRRSTYEDPDVTTRGFGIRTGSTDKHPRDPSVDRQATYPPQPPVAEPLSIPDPRNYQPIDSIPPPIPPPPSRDGREVRRDDRDWPPELDRESYRERDYRDKPRDHKDRDRDRERDRPRDRDRDDRDRDHGRDRGRDYDRYHERDDKSRRDRDRDDRDKDGRGSLLPVAAVAGTAAAAAAGYGLHKKEKDRDDRRDDRRYEDDRGGVPRPPQSAPPGDFPPPPPPPPVDNQGIPPMAGRAPPIPPPERSHTDDRRPPLAIDRGYPDERRMQLPPSDRGLPDERRVPLPAGRAVPDERRAPLVSDRGLLDERRGPQPDKGLDERKVQLPPPPPPPQEDYRKAPDDRNRVPIPERPRPQQQSSDSMDMMTRERHYVDREAERDVAREASRQDSKKSEPVDPDEDYRRRVQAAQADLQRGVVRQPPPPSDRDSSGSDRERRRRERGYSIEHDRYNVERAPTAPTPITGPPGAYPVDDSPRDHRDRDAPSRVPPRSDRPGDRSSGVFDRHLVQDPEEYGEPERDRRINIVAPPKENSPPVRGILRRPTEKFPEDPNPIREGVAPLKDAKVGKDIPPNARWTRIDRRLVNPEALKEAKERFEERLDCVIVLRVLSKDDIQKLADRTMEIREAREEGDDRAAKMMKDMPNESASATQTATTGQTDTVTASIAAAGDANTVMRLMTRMITTQIGVTAGKDKSRWRKVEGINKVRESGLCMVESEREMSIYWNDKCCFTWVMSLNTPNVQSSMNTNNFHRIVIDELT